MCEKVKRCVCVCERAVPNRHGSVLHPHQMAAGLDSAHTVGVFVTNRYIDKVSKPTPIPETRNPKSGTRNSQSGTQNPRPTILNPGHRTRNPRPKIPNPKPETRNPKPETRNQASGKGLAGANDNCKFEVCHYPAGRCPEFRTGEDICRQP